MTFLEMTLAEAFADTAPIVAERPGAAEYHTGDEYLDVDITTLRLSNVGRSSS